MAKRYELKDGSSSKFWEIKTTRCKTIVRYGRIGSDGRVVEKTYDSAAEAKSAAEKLIRDKTRKGYQDVSQKGSHKSQKKTSARRTTKSAAEKPSAATQPKPGEVVDVTGLIESKTADGHWHARSDTYTFATRFQAWKLTKGAMLKGSIRIEEPNISARRFNSQVAKFKPCTVRRVRLKLVKRVRAKQVIGELVKDLGPVKDAELSGSAKTKKQRDSFKDPKLGKFVFDRDSSNYEGKAKWLNKNVSVSLEVSGQEGHEDSLRQAQLLWRKQKTIDQRLRKFACDWLLDDANDWLHQEDENAKPISAAAFKKRIALVSITVEQDGKYVFWLDDGDLFFGHVICVHASKDAKLTGATVEG